MRDDDGTIVIGWLTKLAVFLAVFAAVAIEFVSVGVAKLSVEGIASDAAREGSQNYRQSRNVQRAYEEALEVATERGATIRPEEFLVEKDGTVTLTVRKTANSFLLVRFDQTKGWTEVDAEASARFTS